MHVEIGRQRNSSFQWEGVEKFEIRNPKSEIAIGFPAMMNVTAAGVAEW